MPLWLRESFAAYVLNQQDPQWMPPDVDRMVGLLRGGYDFSLSNLEHSLLEGDNRSTRAYSAFIVTEWMNRYGRDRVGNMLGLIASGRTWNSAAEEALGAKLSQLDQEIQKAVLERTAEVHVSTLR